MATATYDFSPGTAVWVINTVTSQQGATSQEISAGTIAQVTVLSNIFQTKITYKVQLTGFSFVSIDQLETVLNVVSSTLGAGGSFVVAGDQTSLFIGGTVFHIDNSAGNNGSYTTTSATFDGTNTTIVVTGTVPVSSATGTIAVVSSRLVFPDVDSALAAYKLLIV